MRAFGITLAALALASCGGDASDNAAAPAENTAAPAEDAGTVAAKAEVTTFHQRLDAGQGSEIYKAASDDIRSAVTEEQWVARMDGLHKILGNLKSTPEPTVTVSEGGSVITLNYEPEFENGKAKEEFVFRFADGKAVLAGYDSKLPASLVPGAPGNGEDAGATEGETTEESEQ